MTTTTMTTVSEYLKRPYMRAVRPEPDGSYSAEIVEFPGCFATGVSAPEALEHLENVAEAWLTSMVERGQPVPEPIESSEYSGKLVLRMLKSLHKKAALFAEFDGVSLNQYIVNCVSERVGMQSAAAMHIPAPVQNITNYNIHLSGTQASTLGPVPNYFPLPKQKEPAHA